jgi:hypothetical protein
MKRKFNDIGQFKNRKGIWTPFSQDNILRDYNENDEETPESTIAVAATEIDNQQTRTAEHNGGTRKRRRKMKRRNRRTRHKPSSAK